MTLPRVCSVILPHIEEKHALPGLRVNCTKRVKTAHLYCLFTRDGLQGMLNGKNYYAVDIIFSLISLFIDNRLGFQVRCKRTGMNLQYSKIFKKILVDHSGEILVERALMVFWSEGEIFKRVVDRVSASHCPFRFYIS